jgi:type 1 glutamine amidotransferase
MNRPVILLCLALLACAQAGAAPVKVLLIGQPPDHGYRSHTYLPDCELIAKWLKQNGAFETTVARGWPTDPHAFDGVATVVLHDKLGGDVFFAPDHAAQAQSLIDRGIGLVALHWGTGAAEPAAGEPWLKALGGHFNAQKGGFSRYKVEASTLRVADATHPISRGWQDFAVRDEWYYDLRFLPAAKPVALAKVGGKDYPVGWAYERPAGGRSFGFVGLHFHDNLAAEPFRRLIVNGVLWASQVDVPAAGASVTMEPKDLDLPEEFEKLKPAAKPAAKRPAGDPLIEKRMAECASYQERLDHALEHGAAIPQALAETKAFLLTAPGVDPQSVSATGVGIMYKSTEGLGFYLRVPFDRLPGIK